MVAAPRAPDGGSLTDSPHKATFIPHHAKVEAEVLAWFDHTRDRLLRYLLRFSGLCVEDAEDVIQEAFLALYHHLLEERPRHNIGAWLFQVVHNLGLKKVHRLRQHQLRQVALTPSSEELVVDTAPNPEDRLIAMQSANRLRAVVNALTEVEQRCITLRAEGLRYREIAQVLGISLGAVANSLERSWTRLARASGRSRMKEVG